MGYIINSNGTGGGNATAANQQTQITQGYDSETIITDTRDQILKYTTSGASTLVISFVDITPSALAVQIQSFLQGNVVTIISICYADSGLGANPHSCIIVYKF
jgi:hypothetical protein